MSAGDEQEGRLPNGEGKGSYQEGTVGQLEGDSL